MSKRKEKFINMYNEEMKKLILNKPDTALNKVQLMLDINKAIPTKMSYETVEVCIKLNIDPNKTEQNVKTGVAMMHGWTNKKKIGLFSPNNIDISEYPRITLGNTKLIEDIKTTQENPFDVCVAHTSLEKQMNTIAKVLKKTSPNKKYGTLSEQCDQVAINLTNNKLLLISNNKNTLQTSLGTTAMTAKELLENLKQIVDALNANKPEKLKVSMIKSITIATTQSHKSMPITLREFSSYITNVL